MRVGSTVVPTYAVAVVSPESEHAARVGGEPEANLKGDLEQAGRLRCDLRYLVSRQLDNGVSNVSGHGGQVAG